jgi:hypothetical protein
MHGRNCFTSVNDPRYQLLKVRCGDEPQNADHNVEMTGMPTCEETLQEHIKRSNESIKLTFGKRLLNPCLMFQQQAMDTVDQH